MLSRNSALSLRLLLLLFFQIIPALAYVCITGSCKNYPKCSLTSTSVCVCPEGNTNCDYSFESCNGESTNLGGTCNKIQSVTTVYVSTVTVTTKTSTAAVQTVTAPTFVLGAYTSITSTVMSTSTVTVTQTSTSTTTGAGQTYTVTQTVQRRDLSPIKVLQKRASPTLTRTFQILQLVSIDRGPIYTPMVTVTPFFTTTGRITVTSTSVTLTTTTSTTTITVNAAGKDVTVTQYVTVQAPTTAAVPTTAVGVVQTTAAASTPSTVFLTSTAAVNTPSTVLLTTTGAPAVGSTPTVTVTAGTPSPSAVTRSSAGRVDAKRLFEQDRWVQGALLGTLLFAALV